jgi:hypothetical protein
MVSAENPSQFNSIALAFFEEPFAMPNSKDLGWFD